MPENAAKAMGMQANQLPSRSLAEAAKMETDADTGGDDATSGNMKNWMECVRSRQTPNADVEAGYNHSVALCMTIAAIQTGQRVTFDDARQEIIVGAGGATSASLR
jgi:hypothetical protein